MNKCAPYPESACLLSQSGRFPDYSRKITFPFQSPILKQWYVSRFFILNTPARGHGITVAGTVPDSHRIPFYTAFRKKDRITKSPQKYKKIIFQ